MTTTCAHDGDAAAAMTITLTTDIHGRHVALVPDATARLLTAHQDDGWEEAQGFGWGCSRTFPPNHPATLAAQEILTAAAPLVHIITAGEGDWDPRSRSWRNYLQNRDLHPRPFDIDPADGTLRFSG